MYIYLLFCDTCILSCGTVDGAYGPVRNPWQYRFCRSSQQADDHMLHSTSGLQSASHIQRVSRHARDYHASSSSASSATPVHAVCDSEKISSHTNVDVSDWYITGGSSGGSTVAVATGVAFA